MELTFVDGFWFGLGFIASGVAVSIPLTIVGAVIGIFKS